MPIKLTSLHTLTFYKKLSLDWVFLTNKASCSSKIHNCFHTGVHLKHHFKEKSKKKNTCFLNTPQGCNNAISSIWDLFTHSLCK